MNIELSSGQLLAMDPSQVHQIHANLNSQQSLHKAAEQFEAIFLQLVLKSMHSASDALVGDDGLLASKEQQFYREMYHTQVAQSMAGQHQLGLAEHMISQLGDSLTEVENKFKQLAGPVAVSIPGEAFSQPLNQPDLK